MKNKILEMKIQRAKNRPLKPRLDIIAFDIDGIIFNPVGTYEKDFDLDKFYWDNNLIRNLNMTKGDYFDSVNNFYDGGYYVVLCTARRSTWHMPKWLLRLVLKFRFGLKFDELIMNGTQLQTSEFKKRALQNMLARKQADFFVMDTKFVDDMKSNRDALEGIGWQVYGGEDDNF